MKEGRPIQSLASELERQADAKKDYIVRAADLRVHTNGTTALQLAGHDLTFPLNELSHSQMGEYVGIPKPFYDRLRGSSMTLRVPIWPHVDPEDPATWPANVEGDESLYDLVLNRLLREKGEEKRLVRTLDGKARAVLSDSYNPDLDNFDVYRVACRVIGEADLGPSNMVSCDVTERRLYLKVVSPRLEAVIHPANLHRPHGGHHYLKEPQTVQAGFVLTNSETGVGALRVDQIVYKLQCTNLWVTETAYRQRHLGRILESDEDGQVYRSDTRVADAQARLLKLRDHVAAALDEQRFLALVAQMQQAAEIPLGTNIERTVEATGRKFGLSQAERKLVVRNLIEGSDLSIWGLSNALSAAAEEVESYDRAFELEQVGGRFFNLSKAEIQEIVDA